MDHKTVRRFTALVAGLILVFAIIGLFTSSQASDFGIPNLETNDAEASRALLDLNSLGMKNQLAEHYAQDLYNSEHGSNPDSKNSSSDSTALTQTLDSLREGQSPDKRAAAISALTQAPPAIIPTLLDALTNSDPGIRRGAAEVLGARHAPEAEDALFFATFDSDPEVRLAAVKGLGGLGAIYALPRIQWIQVLETHPEVQLAARLAENQIYWRAAATLGVRPGDLRVVAVAPANERVYAATHADLYVPNQDAWKRVGAIPNIPTALVATGNDGRTLYLGTASFGLYRSHDGGETWEAINDHLPTANPFAVTALTVNPENDRQVFVALALNPNSRLAMSFALYESSDGGDSWTPIAQSNFDRITIRLIVDSTSPARLLGLTDAGTWEYALANLQHAR